MQCYELTWFCPILQREITAHYGRIEQAEKTRATVLDEGIECKPPRLVDIEHPVLAQLAAR